MKKVTVSVDEAYYNSAAGYISDTAFVILHEDDKTMFADVDKIMEYDGRYYILDRRTSRTVVSFTKDGKPVARYGNVGQGPGEYVFPWDMYVDTSGIYILDTNSKKVIRYNEEGRLLDEKSIPFYADAFRRLEDGSFLFNMTPDGNTASALCFTDSMMKPARYALSYPEGYVGGYSTSNIFRNSDGGFSFYRSPQDTLVTLDNRGEPQGLVVFDFQDKSVPQKAKTDYIASSQERHSHDYLQLAGTPIVVADTIWVGLVEDGHSQYTILFNPLENKCGGRKFTGSSSVYDMIEPLGLAGAKSVISLLCEGLADRCRDYDTLPDSVRNALEAGNRVLLLHRFSF